MVMAEVPKVTLSLVHVISIFLDNKAEQKFDSSLAQTMTKIIAFFSSLEV
jgi:hypothetical protein